MTISRRAMSRVPGGPALMNIGALGALSASAFACGDVQSDGVVPPTVDAATTPPSQDGGTDARDASANVDSGYRLGLYDAAGHKAADALADAASDGHIFEPPCGVPPPLGR